MSQAGYEHEAGKEQKYVSPKRLSIFNGLHLVILQKAKIFIISNDSKLLSSTRPIKDTF
jgi:hypothetical protein